MFIPATVDRMNSILSRPSIVAIHGIGAHPDDAWCKNVGTAEGSQQINWLDNENMLPAVAPNIRIMRYGYQSQWFGEEAIRQNTSTVAQRLLLALRRERKVEIPCIGLDLLLTLKGLPFSAADLYSTLLWWAGRTEGKQAS